jgi:DNA-binding response OmpR family regulator
MGTFATRVLRRAGFHTRHVPSGEQALKTLAEGAWDGLLTDVQLPGMSGLELTAAVRLAHPSVAIAVMTAYSSVDLKSRLEQCGADAVLTKPLTPAGLAGEMRNLLARTRSRGSFGSS